MQLKLIFLAFSFLISMPAAAQYARRIVTQPALPASCSAAAGDVVFLSTGNRGLYRCVRPNVWAKLDNLEILNVKDFGAVGDGITDDTAAIQAAHDYAVSSGSYYQVVVPAGIYQFTTLTWSPHVQARASGKVYLRTANASGRTIQISDQYGRPSLYGLNSPLNAVFDGQFYLINTNGANTAIAWSFGGLTTSYYCALNTVLRGIETRGFHGGVYEFLHNAFLLNITDCFDWNSNGSRVILNTKTNSGGVIKFINTVFGNGNGYVLDIHDSDSMVFDFVDCSADHTAGLNRPGNVTPLLKVNWMGGSLEWSALAAPYLQNDGGAEWNIDGAMIINNAAVGHHDPVISQTDNASATRFINIKYVFPGGIARFHDVVDGLSAGMFDYYPNCGGAGTPTIFLSHHANSVIGYNGINFTKSFYTCTWSGTIGNGTIAAYFQKVGQIIHLWIKLVWGSTTSHGAVVQAFALPLQASTPAGGLGSWWANDWGTGAHTGTAKADPGAFALTLWDDATALQVSDVVPMVWAQNDEINIYISYFVD